MSIDIIDGLHAVMYASATGALGKHARDLDESECVAVAFMAGCTIMLQRGKDEVVSAQTIRPIKIVNRHPGPGFNVFEQALQ